MSASRSVKNAAARRYAYVSGKVILKRAAEFFVDMSGIKRLDFSFAKSGPVRPPLKAVTA